MSNINQNNIMQEVQNPKNWKRTKKKHYEIYVCMPRLGTKAYNFLEDTHYETNEKTRCVLSGTMGEQWTTSLEKVAKTYKFIGGTPITPETLKGKVKRNILQWTRVETNDDADTNTYWAFHLPTSVRNFPVTTSWGAVLTANRDNIEHGCGDFLICSDAGGQPNFNDMWVVNGAVFPRTYDMRAFPNLGASASGYTLPQPKSTPGMFTPDEFFDNKTPSQRPQLGPATAQQMQAQQARQMQAQHMQQAQAQQVQTQNKLKQSNSVSGIMSAFKRGGTAGANARAVNTAIKTTPVHNQAVPKVERYIEVFQYSYDKDLNSPNVFDKMQVTVVSIGVRSGSADMETLRSSFIELERMTNSRFDYTCTGEIDEGKMLGQPSVSEVVDFSGKMPDLHKIVKQLGAKMYIMTTNGSFNILDAETADDITDDPEAVAHLKRMLKLIVVSDKQEHVKIVTK